MDNHIVIVGAGQAGSSVAARLRAEGYDGQLTMFGEEPHPPYQRPPLSKKYLSGEWDAERLYLRPESFWRENDIELVLGARVTRLDLQSRTLASVDRSLTWSKLVFTTGATPRPLPAPFTRRTNVYEVRTLSDVDRLRVAFQPGQRMLVVGGGYIGLETAAVAATAGLQVTLIERAARILERVACAETSDLIRALHAKNGVRILENCGIKNVIGDSAVSAVELDSGEAIATDMVVVGIGVVPCTDIAEGAGVACANGIVVDEFGRTSAGDVWAAGDCASFPFDGMPTRLESVQNAVDQAEVVADDMLDKPRAYHPVPWFWSDQYDAKLQIVGLNRGYTSVVSRASERGHANFYLRDGRLIAVDTINDGRTYMAIKKLFEKGAVIAADNVAKADFDPVAMLRG